MGCLGCIQIWIEHPHSEQELRCKRCTLVSKLRDSAEKDCLDCRGRGIIDEIKRTNLPSLIVECHCIK